MTRIFLDYDAGAKKGVCRRSWSVPEVLTLKWWLPISEALDSAVYVSNPCFVACGESPETAHWWWVDSEVFMSALQTKLVEALGAERGGTGDIFP